MTQLLDGLKLMVVGIGAVFAFLTIMIFWIKISASISAKYAHLLPEKAPVSRGKPGSTGSAPKKNILTAVITAAIHKYREEHRS